MILEKEGHLGGIDMTLEERISIIENKAAKDKAKIESEKAKQEAYEKELINQIQMKQERIMNIIRLANVCIENNIDFADNATSKKFGYGDGYNFCADGIRHHVGLMNRYGQKKQVQYLGIINGGFCGVYDFYTDGVSVFSKHENTGKLANPRINDIEKFLKEFECFEAAFYKWIDSMQ